ncbi:hypothetical protein [Pseudalkalibacillus hwajinpoensis]|nr:hypothetical protein [Pseudalkalibacillus hwajinpoensis]
MAKNNKTKRMVKEGADRAVRNMDQHDLTSMSSQQRKQQQQENLSGGE